MKWFIQLCLKNLKINIGSGYKNPFNDIDKLDKFKKANKQIKMIDGIFLT